MKLRSAEFSFLFIFGYHCMPRKLFQMIVGPRSVSWVKCYFQGQYWRKVTYNGKLNDFLSVTVVEPDLHFKVSLLVFCCNNQATPVSCVLKISSSFSASPIICLLTYFSWYIIRNKWAVLESYGFIVIFGNLIYEGITHCLHSWDPGLEPAMFMVCSCKGQSITNLNQIDNIVSQWHKSVFKENV